MYESFFGFSQRPFAAAPLVKRYFPAASIDSARKTLVRCIKRSEGACLVIGETGIGKTLLLNVLAEEFADQLAVVPLTAGQLHTRREMLQAILFELKLPYRGLEEGEMRLALVDHLTRGEASPLGIALLVDEAHAMSLDLLEELRMMTNLASGGEPRVRPVLAGGMELEELFASPKLQSFSQRLATRCYLEPFDRAETCDYVRFQVAVAGGKTESIFDVEAMDAVHDACDGIPRLINQLCNHALLLAHSKEQRPLDAAAIEESWADLQQLPVPWQGSLSADVPSDQQSSVVEFGALDDEDDVETDAEDRATEVEDLATNGDDFAPDAAERGERPIVEMNGELTEHDVPSPLDSQGNGASESVELDFRRLFEDEQLPPEDGSEQALREEAKEATLEKANSAATNSAANCDNSDVELDRKFGVQIIGGEEDLQVVVDPYAGLDEPAEFDESDEFEEDAEFEEEDETELAKEPLQQESVETSAGESLDSARDETTSETQEETTSELLEEEIVSDRYAELDALQRASVTAERGTSSELESPPISPPAADRPEADSIKIAGFDPSTDEASLAAPHVREAPKDSESDASLDRASHEDPLASFDERLRLKLTQALGPAELQDLRDELSASQSQRKETDRIEPPGTIELCQNVEAESADIIVIDDDNELYVDVPIEPSHPVERQEYKKLFARLRGHGS